MPPSASEEEGGAKPRPRFAGRGAREAAVTSQGKSSEEIERAGREAEAKRAEVFRDHFERLIICTLYLSWAAIVAVVGAWLYHVLLPENFWWLPKNQIEQLRAILTGGAIVGLAGIASGHMKKRLDK